MPCWRASGGSSCIQELLTDGVQVFFTAILPCLSASEGSGSLQELFGVILATKGPTTVGCWPSTCSGFLLETWGRKLVIFAWLVFKDFVFAFCFSHFLLLVWSMVNSSCSFLFFALNCEICSVKVAAWPNCFTLICFLRCLVRSPICVSVSVKSSWISCSLFTLSESLRYSLFCAPALSPNCFDLLVFFF